MPVQDLTTPTDDNSVDVVLKADTANQPGNLTLYSGTTPISEIDFPGNKRFIRFAFPDGYSDFDIRVFEENEAADKTAVMAAYQEDPQDGISKFDDTWDGKASSDQENREFKLRAPQGQKMVVRDKDKDGDETGTLHSYILKFTYNNQSYLLDPSIRNKQMG
ncbi:hypothetical protein [Alteromonas sp. H39]|uniref:hypothetical protein n=1 Tax=Alteromonas sp. H39 TaxID=3389876 RepID=UPI0039E1C6F5